MSDRAQAMLFEAFARSFFAEPGARCRPAELIAMFHYYFLGNPEGIGFDAPDTDYLTCIWAPFAGYLDEARRRRCAPARAARAIAPADGHRWRVELADGSPLRTRHLVLAPTRARCARCSPRRRELAAVAPRLAADRPPRWRSRRRSRSPGSGSTATSPPQRATFSAVSREPTLDSVTVYSRLERPSAEWAARTGGSVRGAALLRLRRTRRRHRHRADARRAGRAVAGDRPTRGVVHAAAADGGHRADVPARQRRHPGPRVTGEAPRRPGGRRLRRAPRSSPG